MYNIIIRRPSLPNDRAFVHTCMTEVYIYFILWIGTYYNITIQLLYYNNLNNCYCSFRIIITRAVCKVHVPQRHFGILCHSSYIVCVLHLNTLLSPNNKLNDAINNNNDFRCRRCDCYNMNIRLYTIHRRVVYKILNVFHFHGKFVRHASIQY